MNRLALEKRLLLLSMLVEGASMRSIARVLDISINTVAKLLQDAGQVCTDYHDQTVRQVPAERVECDEMWSFCYAKEQTVAREGPKPEPAAGDVWTWTAIDPDTKLLISCYVGDRDLVSGRPFLKDLRSRLAHRVVLTTDRYGVYLEAVEDEFGLDAEHHLLAKYTAQNGRPSTSAVERHNLTMRMGMRRYTRRTNGFSKRLARHKAMVGLYMVHYNFVRLHQSLRTTPAMAAGLTGTLHDMEWLEGLIEQAQPKPNRPRIYRRRSQPRSLTGGP